MASVEDLKNIPGMDKYAEKHGGADKFGVYEQAFERVMGHRVKEYLNSPATQGLIKTLFLEVFEDIRKKNIRWLSVMMGILGSAMTVIVSLCVFVFLNLKDTVDQLDLTMREVSAVVAALQYSQDEQKRRDELQDKGTDKLEQKIDRIMLRGGK